MDNSIRRSLPQIPTTIITPTTQIKEKAVEAEQRLDATSAKGITSETPNIQKRPLPDPSTYKASLPMGPKPPPSIAPLGTVKAARDSLRSAPKPLPKPVARFAENKPSTDTAKRPLPQIPGQKLQNQDGSNKMDVGNASKPLPTPTKLKTEDHLKTPDEGGPPTDLPPSLPPSGGLPKLPANTHQEHSPLPQQGQRAESEASIDNEVPMPKDLPPPLPQDQEALAALKTVINSLGKGQKLVLKEGEFTTTERSGMSKLTTRNVGGGESREALQKVLDDLKQISTVNHPDIRKEAIKLLTTLENNDWASTVIKKNEPLEKMMGSIFVLTPLEKFDKLYSLSTHFVGKQDAVERGEKNIKQSIGVNNNGELVIKSWDKISDAECKKVIEASAEIINNALNDDNIKQEDFVRIDNLKDRINKKFANFMEGDKSLKESFNISVDNAIVKASKNLMFREPIKIADRSIKAYGDRMPVILAFVGNSYVSGENVEFNKVVVDKLMNDFKMFMEDTNAGKTDMAVLNKFRLPNRMMQDLVLEISEKALKNNGFNPKSDPLYQRMKSIMNDKSISLESFDEYMSNFDAIQEKTNKPE